LANSTSKPVWYKQEKFISITEFQNEKGPIQTNIIAKFYEKLSTLVLELPPWKALADRPSTAISSIKPNSHILRCNYLIACKICNRSTKVEINYSTCIVLAKLATSLQRTASLLLPTLCHDVLFSDLNCKGL
jgi:hypothetical protein